MSTQRRTLLEHRTTLEPARVLDSARAFFSRRNSLYAAFVEQESPTHVTLRGQGGEEIVIAATEEARAILCRADEVNYLSGPGKGVILIKLGDKDRVLGFIASTGDRDIMRVETSRGAEQTISTTKYEVTGRGGKGRELLQRGQFTRVIPQDVENPPPLSE